MFTRINEAITRLVCPLHLLDFLFGHRGLGRVALMQSQIHNLWEGCEGGH